MPHLEAAWPSMQNILIADTILAEPEPGPFWGLGGKIHFYGGKILIFIICLKQIFLSTTKFAGHKKDFGVTAPECPPCLRAWAEPSPESLPLGTFMFVQGI